MRKPSFFNATGYMVAALLVIASAAAIALEATEARGGHNELLGFVLVGLGALGVAYVVAGVSRPPVAALWRLLRRWRGAARKDFTARLSELEKRPF